MTLRYYNPSSARRNRRRTRGLNDDLQGLIASWNARRSQREEAVQVDNAVLRAVERMRIGDSSLQAQLQPMSPPSAESLETFTPEVSDARMGQMAGIQRREGSGAPGSPLLQRLLQHVLDASPLPGIGPSLGYGLDVLDKAASTTTAPVEIFRAMGSDYEQQQAQYTNLFHEFEHRYGRPPNFFERRQIINQTYALWQQLAGESPLIAAEILSTGGLATTARRGGLGAARQLGQVAARQTGARATALQGASEAVRIGSEFLMPLEGIERGTDAAIKGIGSGALAASRYYDKAAWGLLRSVGEAVSGSGIQAPPGPRYRADQPYPLGQGLGQPADVRRQVRRQAADEAIGLEATVEDMSQATRPQWQLGGSEDLQGMLDRARSTGPGRAPLGEILEEPRMYRPPEEGPPDLTQLMEEAQGRTTLAPETPAAPVPETPTQAPIQVPETPLAPGINAPRAVFGNTQTYPRAKEPDVELRVALVEVDDPNIIVSNDPNTFEVDPRFPIEQLQPRERGSKAMRADHAQKAIDHDPRKILDPQNQGLGTGLPIVGREAIGAVQEGQFVVESGNGRMMVWRDRKYNAYEKYRKLLEERAEQFGIDPAELANYERPVLVRIRETRMDEVQRKRFVREAQPGTGVTELTPAERARQDAQFITPQMLNSFIVSESDRAGIRDVVTQVRNNEFVRRWMDQLPEGERNLMVEGDSLSVTGVDRIRNALFAYAFGDDGYEIVRRFFQSEDDALLKIQNGVAQAIPGLAKVRARIIADPPQLEAGADIAPSLVQALDTMLRLAGQKPQTGIRDRATALGKTPFELKIEEALERKDLEQDLLLTVMARTHARSPKPLAMTLNDYTSTILRQPDASAPTLMGMPDPEPIDRVSVLAQSMLSAAARDNPADPWITDMEIALMRLFIDDPEAGVEAAARRLREAGEKAAAKMSDEEAEAFLARLRPAGYQSLFDVPEATLDVRPESPTPAAPQKSYMVNPGWVRHITQTMARQGQLDKMEMLTDRIIDETVLRVMEGSPRAPNFELLKQAAATLQAEAGKLADTDALIVSESARRLGEYAGQIENVVMGTAAVRRREDYITRLQVRAERQSWIERSRRKMARLMNAPVDRTVETLNALDTQYDVPAARMPRREDLGESVATQSIKDTIAVKTQEMNPDDLILDAVEDSFMETVGAVPPKVDGMRDAPVTPEGFLARALDLIGAGKINKDLRDHLQLMSGRYQLELRQAAAKMQPLMDKLKQANITRAELGELLNALDVGEPPGGVGQAPLAYPPPQRLMWLYNALRDALDIEQNKTVAANPNFAGAVFSNPTFLPHLLRRPKAKQTLWDEWIHGSVSDGQMMRFMRSRTEGSLMEKLEAWEGYELITDNPIGIVMHRLEEGIMWRSTKEMLQYLEAAGHIVPASEAPAKGFRTINWRDLYLDSSLKPQMGEEIAMSVPARRWLRFYFGPKTIPLKLGDWDMGAFLTRENRRFKRLAVSVSAFQHIDYGTRHAGHTVAVNAQHMDQLLRRVGFSDKAGASIPRGSAVRSAGLFMDIAKTLTSKDARKAVQDSLIDDTPWYGDGSPFSNAWAVRHGFEATDFSWGTPAMDRFMEQLIAEAPEGQLGRIREIAGNISRFQEAGLFDGFATIASLGYLRDNAVPMLRRAHPDWSPRRVGLEAIQDTNVMYSTIPYWQVPIPNRLFHSLLQNGLFSLPENVAWASMVAKSVWGKSKQLAASWWVGLFAFLGITANAMHAFSTWKRDGKPEPLPPDRYMPFEFDSPFGMFGSGLGRNRRFLSPDAPWTGRNGNKIYIDLLGQADTIFSPADGWGMIRSRLNVLPGATWTQFTGKDFFGRPVDSPADRAVQAAQDIFMPISFGHALIDPVRANVPGAENILQEQEGRLGIASQFGQALGLNLRAETTPELLDRYAFREHGITWDELEPHQELEVMNRNPLLKKEMELRQEMQIAAQNPYALRRRDRENAHSLMMDRLKQEVVRYESGEIAGFEFRQSVREIEGDYYLAAALADDKYLMRVSEGEPPSWTEEPMEAALYAYYDIYQLADVRTPQEKAQGVGYKANEKVLEHMRGQLWHRIQSMPNSKEIWAYIDRNTGLMELPETVKRLKEETRMYARYFNTDETFFYSLVPQMAYVMTNPMTAGNGQKLSPQAAYEIFVNWKQVTGGGKAQAAQDFPWLREAEQAINAIRENMRVSIPGLDRFLADWYDQDPDSPLNEGYIAPYQERLTNDLVRTLYGIGN